jgi:hypothetical protein
MKKMDGRMGAAFHRTASRRSDRQGGDTSLNREL